MDPALQPTGQMRHNLPLHSTDVGIIPRSALFSPTSRAQVRPTYFRNRGGARWRPTMTRRVRQTKSSPTDSLEELKARRADKAASTVDVDETELAENLELPGADLSDESLTVRVLPRQEDEFTCSVCFLVHHRSQLAKEVKGMPVCTECV